MEKRHPGIVTFGILGMVIGTIGLLINGFLVIDKLLNLFVGAQGLRSIELIGVIVVLALTANVVASIMMITSGIGVFSLQTWARIGFVCAATITIVNRIIVFPMHFMQTSEMGTQATANQIAGIIGDVSVISFNILILWFFRSASIKALFKNAVTP